MTSRFTTWAVSTHPSRDYTATVTLSHRITGDNWGQIQNKLPPVILNRHCELNTAFLGYTCQADCQAITTLDDLVFGEDQRSPVNDLSLQFVALTQFDAVERKIAKALLANLILRHNTRRAIADDIKAVSH